MMAEVQALHLTVKRWSENPRRPRSEVAAFSSQKSGPEADKPFTRADIAPMMARLRRVAPTTHDRLLRRIYPLLFTN
jgi:hypothetical protein